MEFIVKDKGGDWYFDGDRTYHCINKIGGKVGKIYQEYVPDPVALWQEKCKAADVDMSSQIGKQLRPSNVVQKLWEHKYANANA